MILIKEMLHLNQENKQFAFYGSCYAVNISKFKEFLVYEET